MKSNFLVRNVNIGLIINEVIKIKKVKLYQFASNLGVSRTELNKYLKSESIDTMILLKISKILRYDFFRLYSSHLMLHHGISNNLNRNKQEFIIQGINIRKNVYTKEMVSFLILKVRSNEMKANEVIKRYGIPKTTFYKWLQKYPD
jgi:hypothetical protein